MLLANPRKESYRRPVMMQPMHCTPAKMGAGARIDWQSGLLWLRTIFLGSQVLRGGAERLGCAGSGLHDLRGPRKELGGRRESRRTGLPVPMKQAFSLPGPTAFAYLTAAGSQIPGVCARERESLARTCSSGALAGDLDHPGRLFPLREMWVGLLPECQARDSLLKVEE